MQRFYFFITLIVFSLMASAKTTVFDYGANEFNLPTTTNTSDSKGAFDNPVTKDGITMTFRKGTAQISPLLYFSSYNNKIDLRCYTGNSFTINCTTGATIDSINFVNAGKLNVSATPEGEWGGTYYSTWKGKSASVDFAVGGSTQVTQIIVYTNESVTTVAKPEFTPSVANLYSTTLVSMSTPTKGAEIYYTLDGKEPTVASTKYTDPITISKATTIKAIASINGTLSEIATISYTFPECVTVANFKEFTNTETALPVKITSTSVVTYQNGKYLFLRDEAGNAMQVYGALDHTYQTSDIIPANIVGTKNNYSGAFQLLPIASTFVEASGKTTCEPTVVAVSEISDHVNDYVICKNYDLSITKNGNNNVYTISDGVGTLPLFERFKGITMPTAAGKYDVIGIGNIFDGVYQLYPISFTASSSVSDINADNINVIGAKGEIIVENNSSDATIQIYSVTGQTIYQGTLAAGNFSTTLPQSIYLVKAQQKMWKVAVR